MRLVKEGEQLESYGKIYGDYVILKIFSKDKNQIGYGQKFEEYLDDIKKVFSNVYNITKETGSLWNVIDTFKQGNKISKFHTKHEDTLYLWRALQQKRKIPYLPGDLTTIANFFNIDTSDVHDALADCNITAKVYHELLKKL